MTNYLRTIRLFGRDVHLYLFAWGVAAFGYFGIQTVLMNLYILRLGYGPEFIGLLNGTGMLAWALFCLPAGWVGIRMGVRGAVILGFALVALMNALLLLVGMFPPELRSAWLLVVWVINWIGVALFTVNSTPYLMNITTPVTRNYVFASQTATMSLFGLLGSLAAGYLPSLVAARQGITLDQPGPYWATLWLVPIFFSLALLAFSLTRKVKFEEQKAEPGVSTGFPVWAILFFGFITFLGAAGQGTIQSFFNVYLDDGLGVAALLIGTIMGLAQILPIIAALTAPLFMNRWGVMRTFYLASIMQGISMVVLGLFQSPLAAGLGFSGAAVMISLIAPARTVASMESIHQRWGTTMSGAVMMGLALGWSVMAYVGGYLIMAIGYNNLFLIGAGLIFLSALGGFVYLRQRSPRVSLAPAEPVETGLAN